MTEKVYRSIKEVERDFFPALIKKREEEELEKLWIENPEEAGKHIAKEIIEKARKTISVDKQ